MPAGFIGLTALVPWQRKIFNFCDNFPALIQSIFFFYHTEVFILSCKPPNLPDSTNFPSGNSKHITNKKSCKERRYPQQENFQDPSTEMQHPPERRPKVKQLEVKERNLSPR